MSDAPPVLEERHGRRLELILNRPDRRNALVGPLVDELRRRIEAAAEDDEIGCILLRGAGGVFCSGLDLDAFSADPEPEWKEHFSESWLDLHVAMFECSKPIVGALERYAIAGGSGLALACDLLVAGRGSFLHVAEAQVGLPAPMNVAWLQIRAGVSAVMELCLLAERVSGERLVELGLAVSAVDDEDVVEQSRRLADRIAGLHAHVHAATKRMVLERLGGSVREVLAQAQSASDFQA